jgi:hypothetical protein
MCKFYVVSGRVAEVHRFINVPLRWTEQYRARERRELWISTSEGQEVKLVVHSRVMPARCGHAVEAILCEGELVGLVNITTGSQVNYARADPPLVWQRSESAVLAMGLLGSFFAAVLMGWVWLSAVLILGLLLGLSGALLKRLASNARLKMRVDAALDKLSSLRAPRVILRRVK